MNADKKILGWITDALFFVAFFVAFGGMMLWDVFTGACRKVLHPVFVIFAFGFVAGVIATYFLMV